MAIGGDSKVAGTGAAQTSEQAQGARSTGSATINNERVSVSWLRTNDIGTTAFRSSWDAGVSDGAGSTLTEAIPPAGGAYRLESSDLSELEDSGSQNDASETEEKKQAGLDRRTGAGTAASPGPAPLASLRDESEVEPADGGRAIAAGGGGGGEPVALRPEASDARSLKNRVARGSGGAAGAVVGALGGAAGAGFFGAFLTGAAIGGVATIWSGPGAIVGAVVGGVAFALAAGYGGIKLADWATTTPQGSHFKAATDRLTRRFGAFTDDQKANLNRVSKKDWDTLLGVSSYRVGSKEDRQRIREALVLRVALRGLRGAAGLRASLIAAANRKPTAADPDPLQTEINRLTADALKPLAMEMSNAPQDRQAELLRTLIDRAGDMLARPSATTARLRPYAGHFGLRRGLAIVADLERREDQYNRLLPPLLAASRSDAPNKRELQQESARAIRPVVTEQARLDLARALNPCGLDDQQAFGDRQDTRDPLRDRVGWAISPGVKHRIARALYDQFAVQDDRPYATRALAPGSGSNDRLSAAFHPPSPVWGKPPDPLWGYSLDKEAATAVKMEIAALKAAHRDALTHDVAHSAIVADIAEEIVRAAVAPPPRPSRHDVPGYTSLLKRNDPRPLPRRAAYQFVARAHDRVPRPGAGQFADVALGGRLDMATILGNAALWRQFAGFAKERHADENVRAYIEIDQFKQQFDADDVDSDLPAHGRLVAYARDIHEHYVKEDDDAGEDHIFLKAGPSDSDTTNKINIENDTRDGIDGVLGKNSVSSSELFHIFDKTQQELLAHMDGIRPGFERRLAQQGALFSHSGVGPAERIGDG